MLRPETLQRLVDDYTRWRTLVQTRILERSRRRFYDGRRPGGRDHAAEDNRALQHIDSMLSELRAGLDEFNAKTDLFRRP